MAKNTLEWGAGYIQLLAHRTRSGISSISSSLAALGVKAILCCVLLVPFFLPVHRRQLSTSGLSRHAASTHSHETPSGMCWHIEHTHVLWKYNKIQSEVKSTSCPPVSADAEREDEEFLHLRGFEGGCSCFILFYSYSKFTQAKSLS